MLGNIMDMFDNALALMMKLQNMKGTECVYMLPAGSFDILLSVCSNGFSIQ